MSPASELAPEAASAAPPSARVPLRVVQIGFHVDAQQRLPSQLLEDWPSLVDVAEATCAAGAHVSVIQASSRSERLRRAGIDYHFLTAGQSARTAADPQLSALIRTLRPHVLHVHGLCFPHDVLRLASIDPTVPILLQDHASRVPRLWRRRAWRRGLAAATGVAFCAREQSLPFRAAGLIGPRMPVYAIPESSSHFRPGSQEDARRQTGLTGDPCLLWVGHLDRNKDPLTVLEGVSAAVDRLPGLELWCCFGTAPLRAEVARRIESDPRLTRRVHLLGGVNHSRIESLMRAADFFVSGSHREGSGYSLIEALACGLPPLITDIPSFRALTGQGSVGWLWPCGDWRALHEGLCALSGLPRCELRAATRAHFEKEVSFAALGGALLRAYRDLIERHDPAWNPERWDSAPRVGHA